MPKRISLRLKLNARRYSKFQDRREAEEEELEDGQPEDSERNGKVPGAEERGRMMSGQKGTRPRKELESAIDILYENQRGGFLCGISLFSAQALGGLDPGPWTNAAHKPSATDITNAQVPDPTWQWAWKEWVINHQEGLDEDGWEYSFAFSKKFSWHGPRYWNSFVRRRAWIRKRIKKPNRDPEDEEEANGKYFTIRPPSRSKSRASSLDGSRRNRDSMQSSRREADNETTDRDIGNIGSLMHALRCCRIDREKMEAVESFIEHGEEELYHLRERMHDIMRMFVFQASRRLLLAILLRIFNEALESTEKETGGGKTTDHRRQHRLDHIAEAVKHADEEVKKLEFWSDVKVIAESGSTKCAVDEAQGWGEKWTGLDRSGPEAVISSRKLPGLDNCVDHGKLGTEILSSTIEGKGKAKA